VEGDWRIGQAARVAIVMNASNLPSSTSSAVPETVLVRPLLLKPQWMNGLSERLLVSHYVTNYGGALRRLNAIRARLFGLDWTRAATFDINGLKREELIAASSVILHEIYFESLGGQGDNPPTGHEEPPPELARALERDFGSVAAWRAEFTAIAKALAGGSGWAILAWSARLGRLVNQWAADHAHSLPGATPILAIDMYEHSYHLDFGAKATAYVDQVMANLNWERIGARYQSAVGEKSAEDKLFLPYGSPVQEKARISAEELKAALEGEEDRRPVLLDVCLPKDVPRRTDMLAGATMHAPSALPRWTGKLPRDRPIVVYCICGFQVSGTTVTELRKRGYDARALVGGITAWHAINGVTVPLDLSTPTRTDPTRLVAKLTQCFRRSPTRPAVRRHSARLRTSAERLAAGHPVGSSQSQLSGGRIAWTEVGFGSSDTAVGLAQPTTLRVSFRVLELPVRSQLCANAGLDAFVRFPSPAPSQSPRTSTKICE
jgi:Fe-Mn family superoxide dismutase